MKKTLFIALLLSIAAGTASAQYRFKSNYVNVSYAGQKTSFSLDDYNSEYKSKAGVSITIGHSFILHKRPIAEMVRIGLDATWFDLNYAAFNEEVAGRSYKARQGDVSVGIGPSVHVNPVKQLGIHAYFRYNPTFATLFETGDAGAFLGGFSSGFVSGGTVSWGMISVGAEARWAKGKYHDFDNDDDDLDLGMFDKEKFKTRGFRVYVGIRF